MSDDNSPFGDPSEIRQAAAAAIAPAASAAPTSRPSSLRAHPISTPRLSGEHAALPVESPFDDEAPAGSSRPGPSRLVDESVMAHSQVSDTSAYQPHSGGRSAAHVDDDDDNDAAGQMQEDEEEDFDEGENARLMSDSINMRRTTASGDGGASQAGSGRTRSSSSRRNKGKARARQGESSILSQFIGLGRKFARRVEREREQMGLSRASLPHLETGQQPLFDAEEESGSGDAASGGATSSTSSLGRHRLFEAAVLNLSPRDRALWQWANIEDLDAFLREAYAYYLGKGAVCIALTKGLNLVTVSFVVLFSTFLFGCIDVRRIRHDGRLSEVVVDQCFSQFGLVNKLLLLSLFAVLAAQMARFALSLPRLWAMQRFYTHLLDVPDVDVASISWNEVVKRMSKLREEHPITSLEAPSRPQEHGQDAAEPHRMDAHDVANRIMRQENYLIALFNKDVLDIRTPFALSRLPLLREILDGSHDQPVLTRSLQWNLQFCLLDFLFDQNGQVRRQFVTDRYRKDLVAGLRRRFYFMAILNGVFAPFIILYVLVYSFLRYFEEYHKNPASLGSRQYTEFARWKFREFNELPHLFKRRCHRSYPHAQRYINQFPKERTAIAARFVAFVAGSFTAVLLCASVIDPDLFLHFDITPNRNVLFYVGIFGGITAVARGMIPEEHLVFDPDATLREVIDQTHYMPSHWRGNFHSAEVHAEFGALYPLRISIFPRELLSVLVTPFVLWLSLPKSAPAIIDFFKEFTVHVDGLGYVCSFAVFNFERNGNAHFGAPAHAADQRMASKEGKMEQSFLGFKATHPDWQPQDPSAMVYLSKMADDLAYRGDSSAQQRHGKSSGGAALGFTPVNSVLAARSQLYDDALMRSISLAKGSNAAALAASAMKTGPRSARPQALQAVEESRDSLDLEYEDATPAGMERQQDGAPRVTPAQISQQAGVRGLLDNVYHGTTAPARW